MTRRLLVWVGAAISVALATLIAALYLRPAPPSEVVLEAPVVEETPAMTTSVIGSSVEGRSIATYTFGTGDTHLLFVGGMHGGYEWNTVLLAEAFVEYFTETPEGVPSELTLHVIPNLNPDATFALTGKDDFTALDIPSDTARLAAARFNANNVDLNRNFDCKWQPESTWRNQPVSAGGSAFSEPETVALRDYVLKVQPKAVVFWHSQANTVYASECEEGVLPETLTIMELYAEAAGYRTQATFDAYSITGDAEGWLATLAIPAITVELATRTSIEWERNVAGVSALLTYYAQATP